MAITRMDHVGVVVDDLAAAVAFFVELGLEVDGEPSPVQGQWVDDVVGIDGLREEIVFVTTPGGHSRLELTKFHTPAAVDPQSTAPNTMGLRSLMFAVDDIDETVARMRAFGASLIGKIARYEDVYRLCYLQGPDGIIVALAEELH